MLYKSKLRGSFGRIYPIGVLSAYIFCLAEVFIRWYFSRDGAGIILLPVVSVSLFALFFLITGLLQSLRFHLAVYTWLGFHLGLGCILSLFLYPDPQVPMLILYLVNLLVVILIVLFKWPLLSMQERFESNARKLFRLAATGISETAEGYTARPYTAGVLELSAADLSGFSRFIEGANIARSFVREGSAYFVFSMNKSVLRIEGPEEGSYIAIGREGKVSVKISRQDYRKYRESLSFDQLCNALASVFSRFIEYYRQGNGQMIRTELKSA